MWTNETNHTNKLRTPKLRSPTRHKTLRYAWGWGRDKTVDAREVAAAVHSSAAVTNADMTKRARCWFLVGNTNKEIRSLYFNTYEIGIYV